MAVNLAFCGWHEHKLNGYHMLLEECTILALKHKIFRYLT